MDELINQYAYSLIELAKEENHITEFYDDVIALWDIFEQSKDLMTMLNSIHLLNSDKKNIIKEIFSDQINPVVLNFIKILIDNNELCHFDIISQRFVDLCYHDKDIKFASILSKEQLSKEELLHIALRLKDASNYHFILMNKTDESHALTLVIDNTCIDIRDMMKGG